MPELPEVEMARKYLERTSLLQRVESAIVKDIRILSDITASSLEQSLTGLMFMAACRHGKRLFIRLREDLWLTLHLGLTGYLAYFQDPKDEPDHCRLLISFQNGCCLAYSDLRMFGEVGLTRHPDVFLGRKKIGPDTLQINRSDFLEIMVGRRGIIKAALLNQHLVAGLGNLYADESLFQTGIRPDARALDEPRLEGLFYSIQKVLKTSISCQANCPLHQK